MDNSNQDHLQQPTNNENSQTVTDPTMDLLQSQQLSTRARKKRKNLTLIMLLVALLAVCIGIVSLLFIQSNNDENTAKQKDKSNLTETPKAVEQVITDQLNGTKTIIEKNNYYTFEVDNVTYYGQVNKVSEDFLQVVPTVIQKAEKIELTINDSHAPEFTTYFNVSQIKSFRKLDNEATINEITQLASSANFNIEDTERAAALVGDIDTYFRSDSYKSFLLKNGNMIFAKISSLDNDFLAKADRIYTFDGELDSQNLTVKDPESFKDIRLEDIIYWQNLLPYSQIVFAADAYEDYND